MANAENPQEEWKRIQTEGFTSIEDEKKVSDALADKQAREARRVVVKQMGTLTAVDVHKVDPDKHMAVHSEDWHTER